ncbi:MAG TPA: ADP-forming succinate--CoA ligase subunit beta, partial [Gemmatales bacterium]|nr:ADP-forming succinate--CoA ligase subunit beta [Gemmatales bacterium]
RLGAASWATGQTTWIYLNKFVAETFHQHPESSAMKIHEYQAKELLAAQGASVPRGIVCRTAEEVGKAYAEVAPAGGGLAVLKCQVHAGGRGKGKFAGSGKDFGGVKLVKSQAEAVDVAGVMLKYPLVTKQTTVEGQKVSTILVQEAADIERELYVAVVLDRSLGLPILMASAAGGVDIEEVAEKHPELIFKTAIDPDRGLLPFQSRRIAYALGFTGAEVEQAEKAMAALVKVFLDYDASLAEINPLIVTKAGQVQVLDAKMTFDDNALFRHPNIEAYRDVGEEDPFEHRASQTGLSFVKMNGNIGCLVNGAGLAMATMDIIKLHGGEPANFLDVGGGANKEQVTEAFRILLSDPNVKAVLVNIFGGIMKCDIIAGAILAAYDEVGFKVPLVVRLEGTNVEQGKKMLAESGRKILASDSLTEASKMVVASIQA